MRKGFLSLLLAACMLLALLPAEALAAAHSGGTDVYAAPHEVSGYAISNVTVSENNAIVVNVTSPGSCRVAAAVYTEDGRMLGAEQADLAGEGEEREVSLPISLNEEWPDDFTVRAFLLDSEWVPLCEAYTYASASAPLDYARAFLAGYVDPSYADRRRHDQITSTEFKEMLERLISSLDESRLPLFREKVSDYEVPLQRGEGVVMAYYAAVCLCADTRNNNFGNLTEDDFWDIYEGDHFEELFPSCFVRRDVSFRNDRFHDIWADEYTAAYLWNIWHSSLYSGEQTIAYSMERGGVSVHEPLTVEDAVCAVARLGDSFDPYVESPYASSDSALARNPSNWILSEELLAQAAETPIHQMTELPRLTGFVLDVAEVPVIDYANEAGYRGDALILPNDIERIADWGFTSARISIEYEKLFSEDLGQVNLVWLEYLDRLVEAGIRNNVHVNLLLKTLPGRTRTYDEVTLVGGGEFDLFINPERQKEAVYVWQLLAERYRDVPGAYLSFLPAWEVDNKNLSSGAEAPEYGPEDVCNGLELLIKAIREKDPDRFILYEPSCGGPAEEWAANAWELAVERLGKYDNVQATSNFGEAPFIYAEMTAESGEDIDRNNHSMFKPEYPVTIYAASHQINDAHSLQFSGFLPKGTRLEIYLSFLFGDTDSFFRVSQGGRDLYEEAIPSGVTTYEVSPPLSQYYRFSTSSKKIDVTPTGSSDPVTVSCQNAAAQWCGINVILPEEYAVERWYTYTIFDASQDGNPDAAGSYLTPTSTVMICPNNEDWNNYTGREFVIHEDISYTSEAVFEEATRETIYDHGGSISQAAPDCLVRFEDATFLCGTSQASMLRYYEDILSMMDTYGFDWYSNDYLTLFNRRTIWDPTLTRVGRYDMNLELLRLFQCHQ